MEYSTKITLSSLKNYIKFNQTGRKLYIFSIIWFAISTAELVYGLITSETVIVSDSFTNFFKTISLLITLISGSLVVHYTKIELLAALSNCVFLIITSLNSVVEALHLISENSHYSHANLKQFFITFNLIKVVADAVFLVVHADFVLHPYLKIKLKLWKKHKKWVNLSNSSISDLNSVRAILDNWSGFFDNLNCLSLNILLDLLSNLTFLLAFSNSNLSFESIYFVVGMVNSVFICLLLYLPLIDICNVFLLGQTEISILLEREIKREISYSQGVQAIKDSQIWLSAPNSLKIAFKIIANEEFDLESLNKTIDDLAESTGIVIELFMDTN